MKMTGEGVEGLHNVNEKNTRLYVSRKEKKLINLIRAASDGEFRIVIKDRQPVMVEKKTRKFEF